MEQTARFGIPLLVPGQAQKEYYHNEAIEQISMLLCPVVEGPPQAAPPPSPQTGACYLVATEATDAWSGQDGAMACFTNGGWIFIEPIEGVGVADRVSGQVLQWRAGAWEAGIVRAEEVRINGQPVLRQRQPAIADPAGGSVIDAENRTTVAAILTALRAHGLIG